jgi:hypothetical protein
MKEEQDDKILDPEKVKTDSVIKDWFGWHRTE